MLAKTAGVKHLVVLVNKMDDSTVNWAEERYQPLKNFVSSDRVVGSTMSKAATHGVYHSSSGISINGVATELLEMRFFN